MTGIDRESLLYAPLFCEENIWHLARTLVERGAAVDRLWVLLISNPARQVAMLRQRAGDDRGLVIWDYHVILHAASADGDLVYDLDTTLPLPCAAPRYFSESFPPEASTPPPLRARVRSVPARAFLHRFHSDRSHMAGMIPAERFPPWPTITPDHAEAIRLREYWDMERQLDDGSRTLSIYAYAESIANGR